MANGFLFFVAAAINFLRKTVLFLNSFYSQIATISLMFQVATTSLTTIACGYCFHCCCVSCVKKMSVRLTSAILNATKSFLNAISTMTILMKICDSGRRCDYRTIYVRDLNPENEKNKFESFLNNAKTFDVRAEIHIIFSSKQYNICQRRI